MRCPACDGTLKEVAVKIAGARTRVMSRQCTACDYFAFDPGTSRKAVAELRTPLKLKQKVVKLSAGRMGLYFSEDVVRSLGLKAGETVYVSVPDETHLVVERLR